MKKITKKKTGIALAAVALAAVALPLVHSYAQRFIDTSITAYSFEGDTVQVKQVIPYYDSGAAVLYNDDSVYLYQNKDGGLVASRVENLKNVRALADETHAVTNGRMLSLWGPDGGTSYAYSANKVSLTNIVGEAAPYYLTQAAGGSFEVYTFTADSAERLFTVGDVKAITTSTSGGVLLKNDGTVWSFDQNSSAPRQISGLSGIEAIACGAALDKDGAVWTWGSNVTGRLGNGTFCTAETHYGPGCNCSETPVKVSLSNVKEIWGSYGKLYALTTGGALYQWGEADPSGPDSKLSPITEPQAVSGLSGIKDVFPAANSAHSTYILQEDGSVFVLGYNGMDNTYHTSPAKIDLLSPKKAVTSLSRDLSNSYKLNEGDALPSMPSATLTGTAADGSQVEVTIQSWECSTDYVPGQTGNYVFRPVLSVPDGYRVVDSILPTNLVTFGNPVTDPDDPEPQDPPSSSEPPAPSSSETPPSSEPEPDSKPDSSSEPPTPPAITSDYAINEAKGLVSKIAAGTSADSFARGFQNCTVKVTKDGAEVSGSGKIGTGMQVHLVVNGAEQSVLTAVVTGDVNGDGLITVTDVVRINANILNKYTFSEAERIAADVSNDGQVSVTDVVRLNASILGKFEINPL